MGTAMMAPDSAWWHGFYEGKNRFNHSMEKARHLIKTNDKAYKHPDSPNATGDTTRPVEIFGEKESPPHKLKPISSHPFVK